MAQNRSLRDSCRQRQDEFYTPMSLIESELENYREHFKGKSVLCYCDDPFESNFVKFFIDNFNLLGLKKLTASCYYAASPAHTQLSMFDVYPIHAENTPKPCMVEINEVDDSYTRMEQLLGRKNNILTCHKGNGDFRSPECMKLIDECDIVVTNPPFSLFREYVDILIKHNKLFLILGNMNAVVYKDFFPLIKYNKVWLGCNSGHYWFKVPDFYNKKDKDFKIDDSGQKWRRMGNICWFTNIDIQRRHTIIPLTEYYSAEKYPKFDNYNVININRVENIPCDYDGAMGVPITFLSRYNPEQFEILEGSNRYGILDFWGMNENIRKNHSHGNNINGMATYFRIHILNKNPQKPAKR